MMKRIDKDGTWIFIEYYKILQEDYEKVRKENEQLKNEIKTLKKEWIKMHFIGMATLILIYLIYKAIEKSIDDNAKVKLSEMEW